MYFEGISDISIHVTLEPCPFCGEEAKLLGSGDCWWVNCTACMADMHISATKQAAITAWNRRYDQKEGEA